MSQEMVKNCAYQMHNALTERKALKLTFRRRNKDWRRNNCRCGTVEKQARSGLDVRHGYIGQRKRKVMMAERSNVKRCDVLATIFLSKELFHDYEFNNNLNMSAKSVYLLLIRRKTCILDLRLLIVIEDT